MPNRVLQTFFTVVAFVSIASAVIAGDASFSHGLIENSCAPWDGLAITITLTSESAQCDRAPSGGYLSMGVWRGLPLHDRQIVKFGSGSDNGFGSRCAKEGDCQGAESGMIEFEKFKEGSGARGRYELHFKSGETVKGTFDAQWCKRRLLCG